MNAQYSLQKISFAVAVGWLSCFAAWAKGQSRETKDSLPENRNVRPYSENDYMRSRPLMDALTAGFRYIEADTFLVDNRLMIGGSVLDMQSKGTLNRCIFRRLKGC